MDIVLVGLIGLIIAFALRTALAFIDSACGDMRGPWVADYRHALRALAFACALVAVLAVALVHAWIRL